MLIRRALVGAALCAALALSACVEVEPPRASAGMALSEVMARENRFGNYPQTGRTYLSFDLAHGFQVSYYSSEGRSWLWYPRNTSAVSERWKRDTVRGQKVLCFSHPRSSRNPVTGAAGGRFTCQRLDVTQKAVVAELKGDRFNLSSGKVPFARGRCEAPEDFAFDRNRFRCR